ncbi:glycosyltransferase family 4 protein [Candidatus Sumerlaeota bacterium]|nr:glycosyltransferase family 4 protein [Candidatus Sumerlaeota bacterium]
MNHSGKRLRILHLASSERWTGVAEPVTSLALEQQRLGHEVRLGCVGGRSFARKASARGVRLFEGLHLDRRLHPLHVVSDIVRLKRFCTRNRIDVVHCHLLHDHWLAAHTLRFYPFISTRPPYLVRTLHSSEAPRADWLHRWLFLNATDALIGVSRTGCETSEKALGLPAGSIRPVMGAVDLERYRPGLDSQALRRELGIPAGAPVAGLVARMRAGRGLRWLVHAIPQVLARVPTAHFVVVGRGELKKWFRDEIADERFRGQVHWAGYRKIDPRPDLGRADLPTTYAAMNVSLFLGLGSEGSCRAILEAMACARPTVGVALSAVPEIVEDGQTGLLVKDRDEADLVEKLVEMLDDTERCARMGEAARRRAEAGFNETVRAEQVLRVYASLFETRARPGRSAPPRG